jgi:hypothetical protein
MDLFEFKYCWIELNLGRVLPIVDVTKLPRFVVASGATRWAEAHEDFTNHWLDIV